MLCVGIPNLTTAENRSHFTLWCIMAAPLVAGNDVRKMSDAVREILTNIEAIAIDQDPLGVQGHIVRGNVRSGDSVSTWAGKPLYDGSQAVVILNNRSSGVRGAVRWSDFGVDTSRSLYVRDIWKHATTGPHRGGVTVDVASHDVAMLRISPKDGFPIPPIVVADRYALSFKPSAGGVQKLTDSILVANKGTEELPLWKIRGKLPGWLSVSVKKVNRSTQAFVTMVSASGLKPGMYHAIIEADNTEPVTKKEMSTLWYDVELTVPAGDAVPAAK
jgi:hypothetical protein